jgi:hypothetical protein
MGSTILNPVADSVVIGNTSVSSITLGKVANISTGKIIIGYSITVGALLEYQ